MVRDMKVHNRNQLKKASKHHREITGFFHRTRPNAQANANTDANADANAEENTNDRVQNSDLLGTNADATTGAADSNSREDGDGEEGANADVDQNNDEHIDTAIAPDHTTITAVAAQDNNDYSTTNTAAEHDIDDGVSILF